MTWVVHCLESNFTWEFPNDYGTANPFLYSSLRPRVGLFPLGLLAVQERLPLFLSVGTAKYIW